MVSMLSDFGLYGLRMFQGRICLFAVTDSSAVFLFGLTLWGYYSFWTKYLMNEWIVWMHGWMDGCMDYGRHPPLSPKREWGILSSLLPYCLKEVNMH